MAWLEPRTTWSGEDGVTNEDFNRIESNIKHLYETKANQAASVVSYYVSASGNDNNDGLTAGTAFATIQKAISMIPKELGGAAVSINVGSGTYPGFSIANFSGGAINLILGTSDVIISSALNISNCPTVQITGTGSLQIRNLLKVLNTHSFICSVDTTVTRAGGNVVEIVQSRAAFTSSLTVTSGASYDGVLVDQSGLLFVESLLTMPGTGTGIMSDRGSVAAYSSYNSRAAVEIGTARGGRVYFGSQGLGPIS